ncbi:uncharacterized protein G2W53_035283 [Senna tora]|uniref:Uncharacterized protein n=1 Tax=Senna tora TaxID=362788 RepID=A0A834SQ13_9FABA|nr:uncharacterized protein G2W53_035283 [Senna tora]
MSKTERKRYLAYEQRIRKEPNRTQKATHSLSHHVYQNKVGNKKQEVENENKPPSRATFSNSTSRPSALYAPPPSPASTVENPNMGPPIGAAGGEGSGHLCFNWNIGGIGVPRTTGGVVFVIFVNIVKD